MARRRDLAFASLDEVMPDVERLLAGHVTVGRWSLGQICNHLATNIRFTMDGFPDKAPWLVQRTVGVMVRGLMLGTGRIASGVRVPEAYLPKPGLEDAAEAAALRASIERFSTFTGMFAGHPLLGRMRRDQWERFHRIHCAHHLSFALPRRA